MKASEIASKNHITIEDLYEVCKDLGIDCDTDTTEFSDQDLFLVEKKIEVIKNKKSRQIEKKIAGKKIKLKRKVKVSTAVKNKTADEKERKDKKEKPDDKKKKTAEKPVKKKVTRKPDSGAAAKPSKKPAGDAKKGKDKGEKGVAPSEVIAKSDPSKKKKKTKDKEKEKKYTKDKYAEKTFSIKKKQQVVQKKEIVTPEEITIIEGITVGELAKKLNVKANDLISRLMKLGEMATINQALDLDTVVILSEEFGTEVKVVSLFDETVIKQEEADNPEDYIDAPPVVTVMGHVDHGKTKLLDAIRATNVTEQEHGGITQHIGAYMVKVNNKKITFLDTPGHSAFTTMRARGASVTDIVILVVAANDGVMPQTIEAIDHAKEAGVPIIVAINKIDLEDANPAKVKQELSNYDLLPEEWGGQTLFAEISAKQKLKIEELLELVLIQTEMLELRANPKQRARGTVLESKLDVGRGAVTTILVQKGTLRVGDPFVVGVYSGKVRAMFNDQGEQIKEAGPSTPIEVLGISGVPEAGDPFEGVESEKFAKQISQKRLEYKRIESAKKIKKVTLESLNELIRDGEIQDLRIIVKADVDGSAQALTKELEDLSNDDIRVKVIHHGTGGINESDVMLASASNAIIIGFHVRPTGKVAELAEKENVSLKYYNIIFEATDDIKAAMKGMLKPVIKEEVQGTGEIRQTFKVSKIGTAGGSILATGTFTRKSRVRLIRDGVVIYEGELKSLKRYKDDVSEVQAGQEFGFVLEDFNDLKEGDSFEAFILKEIARESAE
jgi:translation initiation factor IF-2